MSTAVPLAFVSDDGPLPWPPAGSDDETPDDDAPAVFDLLSEAAEAVAAAGLLVDALPNLRRAELPSAGGTLDAWQQHRAAAWLRAEDQAAEAWRALQCVVSLLRGLSGVGS